MHRVWCWEAAAPPEGECLENGHDAWIHAPRDPPALQVLVAVEVDGPAPAVVGHDRWARSAAPEDSGSGCLINKIVPAERREGLEELGKDRLEGPQHAQPSDEPAARQDGEIRGQLETLHRGGSYQPGDIGGQRLVPIKCLAPRL